MDFFAIVGPDTAVYLTNGARHVNKITLTASILTSQEFKDATNYWQLTWNYKWLHSSPRGAFG